MNEIGYELVEAIAQARARRRCAGIDNAIHPGEIQNARKQLGLSQPQFADVFGISASTLRNWEQGRYAPSGAAKALLKVIALEPDAVLRALAKI